MAFDFNKDLTARACSPRPAVVACTRDSRSRVLGAMKVEERTLRCPGSRGQHSYSGRWAMSEAIEEAIAREDWLQARRLIMSALRKTPTSHWLIARLSLTYYEQRRYARSLELAQDALALAPRCPLVLWEYAGSLDMMGRKREAIRIYRRLVRRGSKSIAYGRCGEGMARARGLVADCHYRMACCYEDLGQPAAAARHYVTHLEMRGPGCQSIYAISDVRRNIAAIKKPTQQHKSR